MYFKVALLSSSIILFSGCSNPFGPKPSNPKANKNLGVKVVEEVTENERPIVKNEQVNTVKKNSVKVTNEKKASKTPKKKPKPVLKPEPFSLESNEEDPELLGPQSTIGKPLVRDEEPKAENSNKENNSSK